MNVAIKDLCAQTKYWHGTGRYKYAEAGKLVDVLKGIIEAGGLIPHDDDWDPKRGKTKSISFARARRYAWLYAVMHAPKDKQVRKEKEMRYLSGYYYFGSALAVALVEYPFGHHILNYSKKITTWTQKISTKPHTLKSIFIEGSDIPSNYPILIGIRKNALQPNNGSHFFNLHETRSEQPIDINDFTHVEVPRSRVEETSLLFNEAGYTVPVVSIGESERYSQCHFLGKHFIGVNALFTLPLF